MTASQYHKMIHGLYQWESKKEDLIRTWSPNNDQKQDGNRSEIDASRLMIAWQEVKEGIRETCMNMHKEIVNGDNDDIELE